jgi:hypothetical protein
MKMKTINGISIDDGVDLNFVLELATIGAVRLSSSQVTVICDEGQLRLDKLKIPSNARLDWVGSEAMPATGIGLSKTRVYVTFKFEPPVCGDQVHEVLAGDPLPQVVEAKSESDRDRYAKARKY